RKGWTRTFCSRHPSGTSCGVIAWPTAAVWVEQGRCGHARAGLVGVGRERGLCGPAASGLARNRKGATGAPFQSLSNAWPSGRVVHFVLDRVRGVLELDDFGHLELDVAVDLVVVEHATGLEEVAVLVEGLQSLTQRARDSRDLLELFLGQLVEV